MTFQSEDRSPFCAFPFLWVLGEIYYVVLWWPKTKGPYLSYPEVNSKLSVIFFLLFTLSQEGINGRFFKRCYSLFHLSTQGDERSGCPVIKRSWMLLSGAFLGIRDAKQAGGFVHLFLKSHRCIALERSRCPQRLLRPSFQAPSSQS